MNLGIGLGLTNYLRVPTVALDPDAAIAALFESGEEGAWYDPSDSTTVFQDAAGTTPAGVGDPVGLILDKSKGAAPGPELVDTANTAAAWVPLGNNIVEQDGDAVKITYVDNGIGAYLLLSNSGGLTSDFPVGTTFQIQFEASLNTGSANIQHYLLTPTHNPTLNSSSYTAYSSILTTAAATTAVRFINMSAGQVAYIRNISIKELPGNHATQSTSAARPILQSSGGLYYLDFDGVDDWLLAPDHPFTYTGDVSFYAGFQPTSFQTYSTLFSAGTTGNGTTNQIKTMAFSCSSATQINVADRPAFATDIWAPAGVYASTDAPLSTGTDYVAGFVINNWSTHKTSGVTSTINGNSQTITSYGTATPTALNTGPMRVGVFDNLALATSFFNFNMYGMVVIDRTLTAGEISDLESYLADKSGVTLSAGDGGGDGDVPLDGGK